VPNVTPQQLRRAREARGLTQKEAAVLLEVHERTYQAWEEGAVKKIRGAYLALLSAAKKPPVKKK
jgi:DNA-binding transcriptional regulator YiaG